MEKVMDFDKIEEFYNFLQGKVPEGIIIKHPPKLSPTMAFKIIWYLQEHLRIFDDHIEKCQSCKCLYDLADEGIARDYPSKAIFKCENCI